MGDFNAHYGDWFFRTNDPRAAARGDSISDAINVSPFCLLNLETPTRLPSHGPDSSPDLTLISAHLSLDYSWEMVSTLASDHLPIIITSSAHNFQPPGPRKTFTNLKKANWPLFTQESEEIISLLPMPVSCSQGSQAFTQALITADSHSASTL